MSEEMLKARLLDERARHKAEIAALELNIERLECELAKAEHELKELKQPKPQYHLYEVTNGYQGYVPVSVEVMAEDEKKAFAAASVAFRHHSDIRARAIGEKFGYPSDFWLNLKVELIKENAGTHECVFEVKG